jgi:VanZ family protein
VSSTPYPFLPSSFRSQTILSLRRPASKSWPMLLWAWLPVLFFLGLFGVESSTMLGADHTSAPLHALTLAVSGSQLDHNWPRIHHLIRKTGHFLGYGMFSLVLLRALILNSRAGISWLNPERRLQLIAIAGTFAVASLDELHQAFIPNRTGKFADVLLDTAGAIALQAAIWLLIYSVRLLRWHSNPVSAEHALA